MRIPDLVPALRTYLAGEVGVPVVLARPDDGTTRYVVVIATGGLGRQRRVLQGIQFTIDSYGATTGVARALSYEVDSAMHGLVGSVVPIARVTGSTPSDSPDPEPESPRFTATYQLTCKLTD